MNLFWPIVAFAEAGAIVLLVVRCRFAKNDAAAERIDREDALILENLPVEYRAPLDVRPWWYIPAHTRLGRLIAELRHRFSSTHPDERTVINGEVCGIDEDTVVLDVAAVIAPESVDARHPDPLYQSGMTGWTQENADLLNAQLAADFAAASAQIDDAFSRYYQHVNGHLLDAAGVQ